jgi:arylsulfatase A-like enzyme
MSARATCAALLLLSAAATPVHAGAMGVAGSKFALRADAETGVPRSLKVALIDPAIAAPLPDPREGATLHIRAGSECDARIELDPAAWKERGSGGAVRRYRYREARGRPSGIRGIRVQPGRIVIKGGGSALPCRIPPEAQLLPVLVELRIGSHHYCAAFGGQVERKPGRLTARRASAPERCTLRGLNVVLLVADDLGYADLGAHGSSVIPTPSLDALAAAGVVFTDAYVTASTCSPSRAALLTGRYQHRYGLEFNPGLPEAAHEEGQGLDLSAVTMAEVLRDSGYATGAIGKWHLGSQDRFHPLERGFDEFFGIRIGGHPYFPIDVADREPWETMQRGWDRIVEPEYLTDAFAREAASFIERQRAAPFFLYVAFNAVHLPLEAPEEYLQRFEDVADPDRRIYYAMTSALDDAVGAILATLERKGLAEDTLVIFTNDHGGVVGRGDNTPLRGGKRLLFEGGIRVPLFLRWPGVTTPGARHGDAVSSLDLFPTILAAADVEPPPRLALDGQNLAPYLLGTQLGSTHEALFWRDGSNRAVRRGDWKLVQAGDFVWLFDLASDPGEHTNLAAAHPDVVDDLLDSFSSWERDVLPPAWPGAFPRVLTIDGMPYEVHR